MYLLKILCLIISVLPPAAAFTLFGIHIPIGDGGKADANSHPWMISIQDSTTKQHRCGGALVRICRQCNQSDIIMTAAHCVVEIMRDLHFPMKQVLEPDALRVVAGKHWQNGTNPGEHYGDVATIRVNPGWDPLGPSGLRHDIAIIHTTKPIQFGDKIKPIDLPYWNETLHTGLSLCKVSGWGRITQNRMADQLHEINATIVEAEACLKDHPDARYYYNRAWMICTASASGGPTTCEGDSGGVLTCEADAGRRIGYGIVSFGGDICGNKDNSVFTSVLSHLTWIGVTAYELTRIEKDDFLCTTTDLMCV